MCATNGGATARAWIIENMRLVASIIQTPSGPDSLLGELTKASESKINETTWMTIAMTGRWRHLPGV